MKNFGNIAYATLLTQVGVMTTAAVAAVFDVPQEDIETLARYSVSNFKTTLDHENATIFEGKIKCDGKVIATYSDDYMNGPTQHDILDEAAFAPLAALNQKHDDNSYVDAASNTSLGQYVASNTLLSAYWKLKKVHQPKCTKKLIFVDIKGDLLRTMELGFKGNPPFSRITESPRGREALLSMYERNRKESSNKTSDNEFTVIINTPAALAKFGINGVKPYDV
jgi:hypothetical protein